VIARRLVMLLLLIGAASCSQPAARAAAAHDGIVADLERGDLPQAERRVREIAQDWQHAPRSPWYWRFRLLNAEILLAQGKAAEALASVESPLAVDADERPLEARRLKILGHAALNLGRYEEAAMHFAAAAQKAEAAALPRLGLELDVLRGVLLMRTNQQAPAEAATRAALARAVDQGDLYWQAAAANNLGLERMRNFRYDEAIPFLDEALRAADSVRAQRFSAASLANLGICYYRIGEFDKALGYLQRAAGSQERIGAMAGLQSSLGEVGNVHLIQGHADRAIAFYERALTLARANAPWDAAKWAGNLARAHTELRNWDQAELFAHESLKLQQTGDRDSAAYSTFDAAEIAAGRGQHEHAIRLYEETIAVAGDNAELTWIANAGIGDAYAQLGSPQRAREFFDRCLRTIDAARGRLSRVDYKLTFFSRLIEFYQQYVDVLVTSGADEQALQVADASRALLLSERLQLAGSSRAPVTRTGLQQTARQLNVTFLSYWLAPKRSFLWVVSGQTFTRLELPGRERIASLVDAYRAFIDTSIRDPIATDFAAARQLYEMLLAPARSLVPAGSHVIVVPDGPLYSLNLETVPVFDAAPHYFLQEVTISVAPSLALVGAATWPRLRDQGPLLLIGDPEPTGDEFPKLPNAAREIEAIQARLGARDAVVLTGASATPAAYESSRPERFSIIHFAAHATANRDSPLDSSVVLSPHAAGYMLSARDILTHALAADLVTISACRGAGAAVYGGEGLVGFVWAFLQMGARSVIAGLWDVSDRSTAQLMETMYARLQTGDSPAAALRQAKLALIEAGGAFANPYYWGPFQIYVGGAAPARRAVN
jgi:CHAT domain-containing protein/Tfp pilus assembly protein PilF